MRGDGEGETDVHARRIKLDGRLDELFEFGEGDYLVKLPRNLDAAHSEYRAVQVDVFAPRQIRMKARADFEQASDATEKFYTARRRSCNAREDFQERRSARAVVSDDADEFALSDFEVDAVERPQSLAPAPLCAAQASERRDERAADKL